MSHAWEVSTWVVEVRNPGVHGPQVHHEFNTVLGVEPCNHLCGWLVIYSTASSKFIGVPAWVHFPLPSGLPSWVAHFPCTHSLTDPRLLPPFGYCESCCYDITQLCQHLLKTLFSLLDIHYEEQILDHGFSRSIFEELTFVFPVSLTHANSLYILIFYNTHPNRSEASLLVLICIAMII